MSNIIKFPASRTKSFRRPPLFRVGDRVRLTGCGSEAHICEVSPLDYAQEWLYSVIMTTGPKRGTHGILYERSIMQPISLADIAGDAA